MTRTDGAGPALSVGSADLPNTRRRGPRVRPPFTKRWVGAASVVGGLIVWQLIGEYGVKNSLFLATPLDAFQALVRLATAGTLWRDAWVSGLEFLLGYALGSLVGIVVGISIASSRRLASVVNPWVAGFYATPIIALAPLLILWFGVGIASKVAVVFSLVVFPVIISTNDGVRSTDRDTIELARSFGATKGQLFLKLYLPSALPQILTGLRLGIGRGLIGVVVGELFGATAGLGFLINNAAQVFDMPSLFAGLILFAAAGILLTAGFEKAEKRIVHWENVGEVAK
jgi:ABC-type nitrate/sulfonate/bicarbonate transport system, permease component